MGNAGSIDQHTDHRHNMPLKLPMPEPGELEERFAHVLVREKKKKLCPCVSPLCSLHALVSWYGTAVDLCLSRTPDKNLLAIWGKKHILNKNNSLLGLKVHATYLCLEKLSV